MANKDMNKCVNIYCIWCNNSVIKKFQFLNFENKFNVILVIPGKIFSTFMKKWRLGKKTSKNVQIIKSKSCISWFIILFGNKKILTNRIIFFLKKSTQHSWSLRFFSIKINIKISLHCFSIKKILLVLNINKYLYLIYIHDNFDIRYFFISKYLYNVDKSSSFALEIIITFSW